MTHPAGIGLYLHVPYCKALCHYCDFAKTANVTAAQAGAYLGQLDSRLQGWLDEPAVAVRLAAAGGGFATAFLGGGTPSLYTDEYGPLCERLRPWLLPDAEVTMEANPDDVTLSRLAAWRRLGITRLSLGVQTFEAAGLARLKRVHDGPGARQAIAAATAAFPRVNVDLIYGWPGQDPAAWERDLETAVALGVGHLSLYNLTYEARTPLGRAALRGKISPQDDDRLADLYERACRHLAAAGYDQEEVSNWSRPGHSCRHNWLYWSDQSYVGIGAGAHGYLAEDTGPGIRYSYGRSDRAFLRAEDGRGPDAPFAGLGVDVERERTLGTWLTELVGSSLRTTAGFSLATVQRRARRAFRPTAPLAAGLAQGILTITNDELRLRLAPTEWFRETFWAVEVLRSLDGPG